MDDIFEEMSLDQVKGMIFGLAIGDALGCPTEFLPLSRIKEIYGPEGIKDLENTPALYTDDTQMTVAVAEALIASRLADVEDIMANVSKEFIRWKNSPENNRAPGNTCLTGVANMEEGYHWRLSGVDSTGCGSAMRVAPVGFVYQDNLDMLKKVARASSICTHNNASAIAAAIGAAYLIKLTLDGTEPEYMIKKVFTITKGISDDFDKAIVRLYKCFDWRDEEKALRYLGEGWSGHEAVSLAMYCFLKNPNDYKRTVLRAANTTGDSDSIACIAGGISGCRLGLHSIPKEWIERIENREYLSDLALRLFKKKTQKKMSP